ncbi:hypothetical protein PoB_004968500 [Plakobranchus ocellatus]|uniref:Uncharacterized protein n=1 Tax=Plakobranchus ocellatus TaxID=259542 RepID=A0AAV4BV36_9GAST|nr:hypothetical protein PoB_004968500 [Plakobranchus ocellatus]
MCARSRALIRPELIHQQHQLAADEARHFAFWDSSTRRPIMTQPLSPLNTSEAGKGEIVNVLSAMPLVLQLLRVYHHCQVPVDQLPDSFQATRLDLAT